MSSIFSPEHKNSLITFEALLDPIKESAFTFNDKQYRRGSKIGSITGPDRTFDTDGIHTSE